MNKLKLSLMSLGMLLIPIMAYAADSADAVATTISSITVPHGSPWYATIIAALFPILLGALTWLSGRISMYVATKLNEAKTNESGKWYSVAFGLAGMAVRAAETNFGPNTQTGIQKKAHAVEWLKARLISIDKGIEKTPNLDALLAGLVDAAYNDIFMAVAPLVLATPKPLKP